jgi:hypothetical protein
VPLEVLLIDIEPGCYPEESLEFRHDHHMAGGSLVRLRRGDHDRMLPRVGRAPIDGCQVLSNFFSLNFVRGAENSFPSRRQPRSSDHRRTSRKV